jgi:UDP-galactopyranose mutase
MDSLIAFSHLRWNFVYQRPQHLMTRLAQHYRVFFFEEPFHVSGSPRLVITEPSPNISVCTPHTPFDFAGFHDQQIPALQSLIDDLITEQAIRDPIAWLYTPMALPLIRCLNPRTIVYDCMDELAGFKNAPRQLLQREHALLKTADFVFTGGRSLYRAKQSRHHSVHCFPSSVDKSHFASARDPAMEFPAQRSISRPRLGYFGVIDERLDIDLLDRLACAHSHWQLIMVGPVVKIDPDSLPRRPNIHYFGQQPYANLPCFLAGWDVCLLPFALNDATRFISPTKTLEYMAAEKPIVSTPVEDVATPHGHIVGIGGGDKFIALCEQALLETAEQRSRREVLMRAVVDSTSWDRTASEMRQLIEPRPAAEISVPRPSYRVSPARRSSIDTAHRVVVIGAGPTGLSAAYHIGEDCLLLEQHSTVGGWCRSIEDKGFTFDYAGHIMFSNDPYVKELYKFLLGDNIHWQDREAWIYSKGVYTRYPFQGALYGLPPEVIAECIVGAVEARVGPLKDAQSSTSRAAALGNSPSACKAESITDCCADGITESHVPLAHPARMRQEGEAAANFEDFIYQVWGKGIAKHFALPYNRKLWAVPLSTMETSWLGGRVPLPDLAEMIQGALRPVGKPMGPNARFGYPLRGGFQALMNGFLSHLRGTLKLDARVAQIIPSRRTLILGDGSVHRYERLISTMPLPVLVKMAGEEVPAPVRMAALRLRHVSVRCVNLGIGRGDVTEKHWIYYPESSVFHRIFVQGNASPHCNPPGGFGLTCEITYSPDKPLPCEGDALIDLCIEDAVRVGIIKADDRIIARNMVDMPYAYVVYDHGRSQNVGIIREWARTEDIVLAGRYSEWEYYNSDHAFIAGRNAALAVGAARQVPAASSPSAVETSPSPDLAKASP